MNRPIPHPAACLLCAGTSFVPVKSQANGWLIGRCTRCGFVQITPRPGEDEVAALYDHDWDHFAPYVTATDIHRRYFATLLSWIAARHASRRVRILDIGCATGILLEEAVRRGWDTAGIDISADAVRDCRSRGLSVRHGRVTDREGGRVHPVYDVVTALQIVEHEYDPVGMVRAVRNMLAPHGIFVLSTPSFATPWRTVMGNGWVGYQHPEHLWFFTPDTVRTLLSSAGFSRIEVIRDFPRGYTVSYALGRLADYFPAASGILRVLSRSTSAFPITNPVNPWGDMLVTARP